MIAVYLAMLESDEDRSKFMKLYESYEKNCMQWHYVYWKTMRKQRMLCSKHGLKYFNIGNE